MNIRTPRTAIHRRRVALLGALALALVATPAYAQTIEASGQGQVPVTVSGTLTQAKIARAVEHARNAAVPRAFESAQLQATRYAAAGGLTLGAVQSIDEPPFSPFGPYYGGANVGRFGPQRYCGKVTSVKRKTVNGTRRVVSRKTSFKCFRPDFVTVALAVTFAAAPTPPPA